MHVGYLKTFVEIVECGSISQAARNRHCSQSSALITQASVGAVAIAGIGKTDNPKDTDSYITNADG
ncbi:helix-turn-helix domain-containing protein [Dactylosporangium sp. CA-233914]|uniref:helix-turn-helix domain-containing protein n=1 Tax=Dactylosporangium sp. CA-233914 TaxID=3239934 RepID=UPI003D8DEFBF